MNPLDLYTRLQQETDIIIHHLGVYARCYDRDTDRYTFNTYSPEDLHRLHPELWPALQLTYARQHDLGKHDKAGFVDAVYLRAQLQYLTQPRLLLVSSAVAVGLLHAHAVHWSGDPDAFIYLRGDMYWLDTKSTTTYVADVQYNNDTHLLLPALEAPYPGWRDRFVCAQQLGLDGNALFEYACATSQPEDKTPAPELPTLLSP